MEVVAATASVVAVVTIAGQSAQLILRLTALIRKLSDLEFCITGFVRELKSLQEAVELIECFARKFLALTPKPDVSIEPLLKELGSCETNLKKWLTAAEKLVSDGTKGRRRLWRKWRGVSNQPRLQQMRQDVCAHRGQLTLLMNTFTG